MSDEIGDLAEEISRPCVEGVGWLLLTAFSEVRREKWLKDGIVNGKRRGI